MIPSSVRILPFVKPLSVSIFELEKAILLRADLLVKDSHSLN